MTSLAQASSVYLTFDFEKQKDKRRKDADRQKSHTNNMVRKAAVYQTMRRRQSAFGTLEFVALNQPAEPVDCC